MKKTIALATIALSLMSSQTLADEHRGGDAALGALAGAVVLGPIGAIAGAAVGYTAGPSIAHSWGFRHSASSARRTKRSSIARQNSNGSPTPAAVKAPIPSPRTASAVPPPVQTLE